MKPSTQKFFVELNKKRPEKYNFSVISDLENETKNTLEEILGLQSEVQSYKDGLMQQYDTLYSKVFNDELNSYSDINDKLLDVGIQGTDFTTQINSNIEESISELANLKEVLNK